MKGEPRTPSDAPIAVGDLVQAIKWGPCGCGLGRIGILTRIFDPADLQGCAECGLRVKPERLTEAEVGDWVIPLEWLKRIPPLSELESEKREEEIHA